MAIIRAVAFDMDGLMFDTEDVYWKSADALLRRRGQVYTDELCALIMGRPPKFCFETFIKTFHLPETWQELEAESEKLFLSFLKEGYSAMPGLFDLLGRIEAAGLPKAVCTSSSERILRAVLARDGLLDRFTFFITAEGVTRGKPDPQIYLAAAERFGVAPNEMLVFEDSAAGTRSAKAAGAYCLAVRAEHNRTADLSAADGVLNSLAETNLAALIQKKNQDAGE